MASTVDRSEFRFSAPAYGGVKATPEQKLRRERHVLDEFCKRMRRCHRASYVVIPIGEAKRRGIVPRLDQTVDGVLRTSTGHVAVELLGYTPDGERNQSLLLDSDFRSAVQEDLYDLLVEKRCALHLCYLQRGRRPAIPRPMDQAKFIEELKAVVAEVPIPPFNGASLPIRFVKPLRAGRLGRRNRSFYLDAARFPIAFAHFDQVRLRGLPASWPPEVNSNLSTDAIGLDEGWVRRELKKKIDKSSLSRLRATGLPLWLIVHSDGHPLHQMIPEPSRRRAIELCRDVLSGSDGFTRAYWADNTGFVDSAWVGRFR